MTRFTDGCEDVPAIFLAQFRCGQEPWLTAASCAEWAKATGFGAVQLPAWDRGFISLAAASQSREYCHNEVAGPFKSRGVRITHLANHVQGQCVAINPILLPLFEGFAPLEFAGNLTEISEWAVAQMKLTVMASANMDLKTVFAFPGSFAWPFVYPWPQRPQVLIKAAMQELARRWLPVLDFAKDHGQKIAFEVHPGEDIFDGRTFEMFLEAVNDHEAVGIAFDPSHFILQGLDYLGFVDTYADRIFGCHWKDAELNPTESQGVYSGYESWPNRAGRFRSLGDGQLKLRELEARFQKNGLFLWRVLEWECCVKGRHQGAEEGAKVLKAVIDGSKMPRSRKVIPHTDVFDNFAGVAFSKAKLERCLGFTIPDGVAKQLGLAV